MKIRLSTYNKLIINYLPLVKFFYFTIIIFTNLGINRLFVKYSIRS